MNSWIYGSEETTLRERRLVDVGIGIIKGRHIAVVGLPGSGRNRVLSALYVDAFRSCARFSAENLNANLLLVDMQNLLKPTPVHLYQLLLRTISEQYNLLKSPLHGSTVSIAAIVESTDLFHLQSKLRSLIRSLAEDGRRVVLVMDRFDAACGDSVPIVLEALEALAMGIESALGLVIGLSRDLLYSRPHGRLGQIQKRLKFNCIWVDGADSAETIITLTQRFDPLPSPQQLEVLAAFSGGFPALIDAIANWWQETPPTSTLPDAQHIFYAIEVQVALQALWGGLSFHERNLLHELIHIKPKRYTWFVARHRSALQSLIRRGILHDHTSTLKLFSPLLSIWIDEMRHTIRGHVWFNEKNDTYYQGQRPLECLSPRAEAALDFFLQHPQKKCEKDLLIAHVWETPYITDDSVYQVVRELRRELEPNSRKPCYLLNHRSLRGGRYQFFPEGYEPYRG